jgi:hypothetical protein
MTVDSKVYERYIGCYNLGDGPPGGRSPVRTDKRPKIQLYPKGIRGYLNRWRDTEAWRRTPAITSTPLTIIPIRTTM